VDPGACEELARPISAQYQPLRIWFDRILGEIIELDEVSGEAWVTDGEVSN
jgi:hypothetical protein